MSIKLKLYGGFGILVALTLGLVVYAVVEFSAIGVNVIRMNGIAANNARTLQVQGDLEKLRRTALRYVFDHDEASLKENTEVAAATTALLQESEKSTPTAERKKVYRALQDSVASTQQDHSVDDQRRQAVGRRKSPVD
jgi:hypothetical protein